MTVYTVLYHVYDSVYVEAVFAELLPALDFVETKVPNWKHGWRKDFGFLDLVEYTWGGDYTVVAHEVRS